MEIDERRVSLAEAYLDGKDYAIHKVTRAGFTTSFVIAAERSGKRVLLVSPTKKIINDTMNVVADGVVGIYGNIACKYNQQEVDDEPLLGQLPMSLPTKCDSCEYAEECPILEIERKPDAPMKSLTVAKLETILLSDSDRAKWLREILRNVDVVLFDEAHTLVTNDVARVPLNAHMHDLLEKISQFPALIKTQKKWTRLRSSVESIAEDLWRQVESDPDNWLVREISVPLILTGDEQLMVWGELRKLAKAHNELGVTDEEVLQLRDVIEILSNNTARLSYISHEGAGTIYVCAAFDRINGVIRNYFKNYAENASAIFVSGTLFEPYPNFFREILGRDKFMGILAWPIEQSVFPDRCKTNSMMTVYADTAKLSGTTNQKQSRIPKIIERIKELSNENGNAPIHVLAPNIRLYMHLRAALSKEYPNIQFDYYRSSNTIGVASDIRIIIAVGLAEVPKNAYDCLANSYNESQTIRVGSVDAATWQAWSRGKDPRGQVPSQVYCIGAKAEDIERVLTWGPGRRIVRQGEHGFGVVCDKEMSRPVIMAPYKKQVHAEQRKASPYINKIWDSVEGDLNGCPIPVYNLEFDPLKSLKSRIINIRENSILSGSNLKKIRCFGAIFSRPANAEQRQITIETLDRFFRSNRGQHAEQQKNPKTDGKFPYYPHNTTDWDLLMFEMLAGKVTPATYGMGEDGMTVQCAFDIDNHGAYNPAKPRLLAAKSKVEELGAQAIVVASGSVDSYHIHIPTLRTPIEISYNFLDTVLKELKQRHRDLDWRSTETFPKQKNKQRKLGNALKMPLALNNKTGRRSEILGDDLEPVEVEFITRVVELRQPEAEIVKTCNRQYLPVPKGSPNHKKSAMRPCIIAAIDKQLNGDEGHSMRLAVACEAIASGLSCDKIIELFNEQEDYEETTTAKNVDYLIRQGYSPWKCETIRAKCSSFVDCSQCPYNGAQIQADEGAQNI